MSRLHPISTRTATLFPYTTLFRFRSTQVPRRRGTRGVPPMTGFTQLTSRTVVLRERNIDTDQIIPARFLTTTQREGLGRFAFNDWRYLADGRPNPDFALNRPENAGAAILVAGDRKSTRLNSSH